MTTSEKVDEQHLAVVRGDPAVALASGPCRCSASASSGRRCTRSSLMRASVGRLRCSHGQDTEPARPRGRHPEGLLAVDVLWRLPAPRHVARGPAAAVGPAAARRAALHHPAPDERALAQADDPRAALPPARCCAPTTTRPRSSGGAGQAHPAHTLTDQVVGVRDADAVGVRRDPAVPRDQLGLPVRAVPRGRVPPRQQERRHGEGLLPRRGGPHRARRAAARAVAVRRVLAQPRPPGYAVPQRSLDRDWTLPHTSDAEPSTSSRPCTRAEHWASTRPARSCRRRGRLPAVALPHLQVVQRVIGDKVGTGGSSGVDFLRAR